ncbi:acyltransferase family protein [Pseudomonas sp. D47]|uniref:acyltransferase family protein n=1 Tax=Pseudomonas sp. D47 TaxID=3159447 RepID=UPI00387B1640
MSSITHNKNLEIEALRAIAVFLPVMGHLGNLLFWYPEIGNWSYGLWAGVDIFFCISGYVIANAFYKTFYASARLESKATFVKEMVSFYIRRAYRIMPSAMLWILIVCALSVTFNQTGIFTTLKANIFDGLSVAMFMSNIHFASCYLSTLGNKVCGSNGIYWSISLEEQFYFIFPFLFLLRLRWIFWLAAAVLVGTGIAYFNLTMLYVLYTRMDGIMLGVCLAIFRNTAAYSLIEPKFIANSLLKYFTAIALISAILIVPSNGGVVPFVFTAVTLLCTLTVWLGSYQGGYLFPKGIVRNALAYVGVRSFAIYLVHNPAFWLTREIWARVEGVGFQFDSQYDVKFCITAITLIAIFSELNYRFIEKPFRKIGIEKSKAYLRSRTSTAEPAHS